MKKIYEAPIMEVQSLGSQNDVMVGIFLASTEAKVKSQSFTDNVTDTSSVDYNYWKNN